MLIKSYKTGNTFKISVDDIDFVSYSKGNFLEGDKIHIGVSGNQLTITGSKDNQTELRNFYNNLIKVRNDEKMGFNYIEDNEKNNNLMESSKNISSILEKHLSSQKSGETEHVSVEKTSNKEFDPTEVIRKYYNLMKDGIISEEEFKEKKNELLNYKYY